MVNVLPALSLATKLFSAFSQYSKKVKEEKVFADFLTNKYRLPPIKEVGRVGGQYGGGYSYEICSQEWENKLAELVHKVMIARHVDDEVMGICGDLALFIVILPDRRKQDEGPCYGESGPYSYLRPLQNTETWRSLLEMGRGRGGDYALRLIQRELQEWLGALSFDLLSKGQSPV